MGLCSNYVGILSTWESWHVIGICSMYKYLRSIIQLISYYGCCKPIFKIKHHPRKCTRRSQKILYSERLESFNSLNIYSLPCLLIMALLWWVQRKSFKIIIRRAFCQWRRKQVYTVLKVINKFHVSTAKYQGISQRNKIKIITCPRWHILQPNWWKCALFTQQCKYF